jgi:hypothetical protein
MKERKKEGRKGGREGRMEERKKEWKKERKEGGCEGRKEEGKKEGREGRKERRKKRGIEAGKEGWKERDLHISIIGGIFSTTTQTRIRNAPLLVTLEVMGKQELSYTVSQYEHIFHSTLLL